MRQAIRTVLTAGLLTAWTAPAQMHQIEGEKIRPHVRFLAHDLLEGRGVGQRGGQLAAQYIAAQFASVGLKPGAPGNRWFQPVPLRVVEVAPGPRLSAEAGRKRLEWRWLQDFVGTSHQQAPKAEFSAEAVFVGHGISAPEYGWDDYAGTDVRGKVVVLFTNEPPSQDEKFFQGRALTYYGRWTYKYEEAARRGAVAALIIHTAPTASYGWQVVRANGRPQPQVKHKEGEPALAFAGWITEQAGAQLAALAGEKLEDLLKAADTRGFRARPLGRVKIRGRMQFRVEEIETENVVGFVEGSDPKLAGEAVVFSAHWDHLGVGEPVNGDSIYNGALDNATGCAMLVEMARAWASMKPKPLRPAYFVAVTAEESGLLGSRYFAENPPVPAARIAAALNFDSYSPYGRVRDAVLTGAERTSFYSVVQSVAQRHQLTLKPDPRPEAGGYYRSDHFSFARVGVPAFSVNMGSDYEGKPQGFAAEIGKKMAARYHQPSDEYSDDWDFSGLEQFARFGFALGVEIANLEKLPARVDAR